MAPTTSPEADWLLAYVSLGSNIRPHTHLAKALEALASRLVVKTVSSVYASAAKGAPGTPPFLNAAVAIETDLSAERLKFDVLRPLEAEMGRVRGSDPNAPRVIDLDLSLFGDLVLDQPDRGLVLPDPELLTSGHVILPLAEIAGDLRHPVTGSSLAELAEPFLDSAEIHIVGLLSLPQG